MAEKTPPEQFTYMNSYRITTQADTSSKSRQTRTWTIKADDIDVACSDAYMRHMKVVGWNASVWVEKVEVVEVLVKGS